MSEMLDCDVLVVGAGPTGMTLGLLSARNGLRTIVIDKAEDIYPLPRAAHIDHEIMRIFQELGVADEVAASSRTAERYDFLTAQGDVLLRFEGTNRLGPGGWPASNMIHQPSIEALLREAAAPQKHLELHRRWSWESCVVAAGRVASSIATPDGVRDIRSRFLIGADGARSPVRTAMKIDVDDLGFDEQWLVIDVLVRDQERLPKANLQICDPLRPTTCVLMGSGRHRWEFMLKPGETAEQMLDDGVIADLLKPWRVEGAVSLERKAVYRFHARVAKAWRAGPILLAGDAAHLMPPFAGQGLCSGLRDAANLAWKLKAVCGGSDEGLLDTYQSEREPQVRSIIMLAMMMGRTVCITDPVAARARDEQMLAARADGTSSDGALPGPPLGVGRVMPDCPLAGSYFPQPVSATGERFDNVLGSGAWLIAQSLTDGDDASADLQMIALDDLRLAPFRGALEAWLAKSGKPAVLIRPDRYVFGTGTPSLLARAWRSPLSARQVATERRFH